MHMERRFPAAPVPVLTLLRADNTVYRRHLDDLGAALYRMEEGTPSEAKASAVAARRDAERSEGVRRDAERSEGVPPSRGAPPAASNSGSFAPLGAPSGSFAPLGAPSGSFAPLGAPTYRQHWTLWHVRPGRVLVANALGHFVLLSAAAPAALSPPLGDLRHLDEVAAGLRIVARAAAPAGTLGNAVPGGLNVCTGTATLSARQGGGVEMVFTTTGTRHVVVSVGGGAGREAELRVRSYVPCTGCDIAVPIPEPNQTLPHLGFAMLRALVERQQERRRAAAKAMRV
jgi:hypothetical protein